MGLGCIADIVHHMHSCIHSGIKTDGVICAADVVVNGTRQTDTGNTRMGQIAGASVGTIAADNNNALDAQLTAVIRCLLNAFGSSEFRTSGGVKHGAASVDNIRNAPEIHLYDFACDKTVIASLHSVNVHSLIDGCSDDCTDSSVHTGRIAAAGENRD